MSEKLFNRLMAAAIALMVIGLGALIWFGMPGSEPAQPIDPPATFTPTPTACTLEDVGHCGCEGACAKCHHLCLECKCGSHIIDRGIKCQEYAACESGCSSVEVTLVAFHTTPPENIVKAWNLAKQAKETAHVHKAHNPHNKTDCNNEYHSAQNKMDEARALLGSDVLNLPTTDQHHETIATEFDEWDRDWGRWGTYCDSRHATYADRHAFHIVQTLSTACREC